MRLPSLELQVGREIGGRIREFWMLLMKELAQLPRGDNNQQGYQKGPLAYYRGAERHLDLQDTCFQTDLRDMQRKSVLPDEKQRAYKKH